MSETINARPTPMNLQPLINDDEDIQLETLPPVPPRPRRRRGWLIALVVVLLALLVGGGGALFYMQKTSPPPVQYTQQATTVGNITLTASASGPISTNAEYDMNFSVAGQVSAIEVHTGQQVKAGQTLATLKSTNLQDAVIQAQQGVTNAQTTYNDAYNNGASQTVLDTDYNNVLSAQDQLKAAQDNMAATKLMAPANATVASISGKVGQSAGASAGASSSTTPFIALIDTSALDIDALVNEADIGNVQRTRGPASTVHSGSIPFPDVSRQRGIN